MFFREINGADQSKRLKIAENEGFIPTNHSLGPGSALEEKGEKNWSGQKKNIGEGIELRGSLGRGNGKVSWLRYQINASLNNNNYLS